MRKNLSISLLQDVHLMLIKKSLSQEKHFIIMRQNLVITGKGSWFLLRKSLCYSEKQQIAQLMELVKNLPHTWLKEQ